MGLLSRLYRHCKADVHGVIDQLEDKGLLLKQYLREMEDNLRQKEGRLARTDRSVRQLEEAIDRHRDELLKLEKDLDLAVGKEKDDIARMLIRKRRSIQSGVDLVEQRLHRFREEKRDLKKTLDRQRLQYEQLKVKVAGFCRQAELNPFETMASPLDGHPDWTTPTQEEIELELLQRKQSLHRGGDS
jgi:phage shock protein A